MVKILMVDDEINIINLVSKYARIESMIVDFASNGKEALEKIRNINDYNIIIMDIMMPELDGFSALKDIRKFSKVPVIMLSSRSEEYDKLYGFELGIDDYVTKPFSPKELLSRVKAIINRYDAYKVEKEKELSRDFIEYKTLKIDLNGHIVTIDGRNIELTLKEYELLVYLLTNINKAISREELLKAIWKDVDNNSDRTLDTHIKSLRKKIEKYADNLTTIRRVGYRFED